MENIPRPAPRRQDELSPELKTIISRIIRPCDLASLIKRMAALGQVRANGDKLRFATVRDAPRIEVAA